MGPRYLFVFWGAYWLAGLEFKPGPARYTTYQTMEGVAKIMEVLIFKMLNGGVRRVISPFKNYWRWERKGLARKANYWWEVQLQQSTKSWNHWTNLQVLWPVHISYSISSKSIVPSFRVSVSAHFFAKPVKCKHGLGLGLGLSLSLLWWVR